MSSEQTRVDPDEKHAVATETDAEAELEDVVPEAAASEDAESVDAQLARAQETIKDYWDQMMRLRAEIDNNRKRAERDVENAHKYALKSFIENLLPVIDSMEMGMAAARAENATLDSIREGSEMTMTMLLQLLAKQGLETIDPLGEKFDPEKHQAISMVEVAEAESNTVVEVMQKGFALNDRLVRPAMVVVAK